jgi:L-ascorbate metabolism protein UlaG (beta-lactamase superfamily)
MPDSIEALKATLLGGPTLLLEIGGLHFLTDPTFDPAGSDYDIGIAMLHKMEGSALTPQSLGAIDAVLLSHDQHPDNLDTAGRAFLPNAAAVLTTVSGAERLALPNAVGLAAWQSVEIGKEFQVRVTGVPARHGPEGIEAVVGDVTGFVLEWGEKTLYISGDTVWYEGVAEIARRFPRIDAAVLFLGGVRSAEGQPLLTMDALEAVQAINALNPRIVAPAHYAGWQHFREGREAAERILAEAGLSERIRWLLPGISQTINM